MRCVCVCEYMYLCGSFFRHSKKDRKKEIKRKLNEIKFVWSAFWKAGKKER